MLKMRSITIGAILWLEDDEFRAGLFAHKPENAFDNDECADEIIEYQLTSGDGST